MRDLPHLSARLFGTPLLVDARKLDAIVPAFMRRLNGDEDDVGDGAPARAADPALTDGVAVIPIIGSLVRRKTMLEAYSGLTSYGDIDRAVKSALADARVRAILLQVDSFGGEAPGCFELCEQLYQARGSKPIWAVADVDALSAGYAILSQADRVLIAPSGSVGSIGAVAVHCERSQMNEAMGITYTVIRAGARKAELNSLEPLSRQAAEKVQAELDKVRNTFITTVVRARRGLTVAAARKTEAQYYDADDAVALKLADEIATFDEAFAKLAATVVVSSLATPGSSSPPEPLAPIEGDGDEDDDDDDDDDPENPEEDLLDPKTPAATPPTPPSPPTPPATPAAAGDGKVVSLDVARDEGAAAKAAEHREIVEMCQLAGKPSLAGEFIVQGKSLADVRKALIDARAKEADAAGGGSEVNNKQPDRQGVKRGAHGEMWDRAFGQARGETASA